MDDCSNLTNLVHSIQLCLLQIRRRLHHHAHLREGDNDSIFDAVEILQLPEAPRDAARRKALVNELEHVPVLLLVLVHTNSRYHDPNKEKESHDDKTDEAESLKSVRE